MFLFKPAEKTGDQESYRAPTMVHTELSSYTHTAHIWRVDHPQNKSILVALDRLRRCPLEIGDEFWPLDKTSSKSAPGKRKTTPQQQMPQSSVTESYIAVSHAKTPSGLAVCGVIGHNPQSGTPREEI